MGGIAAFHGKEMKVGFLKWDVKLDASVLVEADLEKVCGKVQKSRFL
jgi:hypothetical protein